VKLSLRETMWSFDGPVLNHDHPIQFEVQGLLTNEKILVGQNLDVRPIRWKVLRTRDGVSGWGDDYESPQVALAALQAEIDREE
jgi:hypothetical protein